ncbi:hypothetical protein Calkr_0171 [Caldicellulosiruptor acetigenus I77R1B]|uniref:Uncharacterized protein n=1 Tax=Caldicellulosiruptor acetigenus (strain ATCC 700853 / DSM 12137 / I77R1B) TaxID=632335 RepID=E4S6I5_CALA7|nr:hypothetical protein [Caldicellulosiruptor acetigenus]ADQ39743.1 hypothetical protein Calkr_0171 [Caldicellulosiruptor acetigenus I77R1B]
MRVWTRREDVDKTLKTIAYYYDKLKVPNLQLIKNTKEILAKSNRKGLVQYF